MVGHKGKAYSLGLNQYSDWSLEEFKQRLLGSNFTAGNSSSEYVLGASTPANASVDWRVLGAVTAVKD